MVSRGLRQALIVMRKELKDSTLRQQVAIRRESFESSLAKRARAILSGR